MDIGMDERGSRKRVGGMSDLHLPHGLSSLTREKPASLSTSGMFPKRSSLLRGLVPKPIRLLCVFKQTNKRHLYSFLSLQAPLTANFREDCSTCSFDLLTPPSTFCVLWPGSDSISLLRKGSHISRRTSLFLSPSALHFSPDILIVLPWFRILFSLICSIVIDP